MLWSLPPISAGVHSLEDTCSCPSPAAAISPFHKSKVTSQETTQLPPGPGPLTTWHFYP